MKKIFALTVIATLYIVPFSVFAQKTKNAAQTKTGRLTITVAFEAEQTMEVHKKDGEYETNSKYNSKFTAKYQYSESLKAINHDGFISITEPAGQSTNGKFTYEHSGHASEKAPGNGNSETDEKALYTGEIVEVGTGGIDMPDQGEDIVGVSISAQAKGTGYSLRTVKDKSGTNVDKSCSTGISSITQVDVSDTEPNSSKPPESACAARMEHSASIRRKVAESPAESDFTDNWSPMSSSGSFASGKYQFSFKGSRSPNLQQKDTNGEKTIYSETIIVEGILVLGGGSVKTGFNNLDKFVDSDLAAVSPRFRFLDFLGSSD
ncbi:hypothetical protein BH10ACI2_BH10ACI2_19760 [soil metagenome]